mgnify:FL=1|tara:strand:- start:818 stop:976 length:159 start_codon:yes stop_codon:yes gene_type:complete
MVNRDPGRRHFYISIVKSGVRIGAGAALVLGFFVNAGLLLIIAEILGVAEEL